MALVPAQEWRAETQKMKYPFVDAATLTASNGAFLPETVLVDASLLLYEADGDVWLTQIVRDGFQLTFYVGTNQNRELLSGTYDLRGTEEVLEFSDSLERLRGIFVVDNSSGFLQAWPSGSTTFTVQQTALVSSVLHFLPSSTLSSVVLEDGPMYGDMCWVGGDGVQLRATGETNEIAIDIVGDPLYGVATQETAVPTSPMLRSLGVISDNGIFTVQPDSEGRIRIESQNIYYATDALRISSSGNSVKFEVAGL